MSSYDFSRGWYVQQPNVAPSATEIDARVNGAAMTLCEFAGHECNPEGTRKCKYYVRSRYRGCCIHYHEDITINNIGHCDFRLIKKENQ